MKNCVVAVVSHSHSKFMCHDEIRVFQDKRVPDAAAGWARVSPDFGGSQGGKSNLQNLPGVVSSRDA